MTGISSEAREVDRIYKKMSNVGLMSYLLEFNKHQTVHISCFINIHHESTLPSLGLWRFSTSIDLLLSWCSLKPLYFCKIDAWKLSTVQGSSPACIRCGWVCTYSIIVDIKLVMPMFNESLLPRYYPWHQVWDIASQSVSLFVWKTKGGSGLRMRLTIIMIL